MIVSFILHFKVHTAFSHILLFGSVDKPGLDVYYYDVHFTVEKTESQKGCLAQDHLASSWCHLHILKTLVLPAHSSYP